MSISGVHGSASAHERHRPPDARRPVLWLGCSQGLIRHLETVRHLTEWSKQRIRAGEATRPWPFRTRGRLLRSRAFRSLISRDVRNAASPIRSDPQRRRSLVLAISLPGRRARATVSAGGRCRLGTRHAGRRQLSLRVDRRNLPAMKIVAIGFGTEGDTPGITPSCSACLLILCRNPPIGQIINGSLAIGTSTVMSGSHPTRSRNFLVRESGQFTSASAA